MVGDRHARVAIMLADKTSFFPESKLDEAGVADDDGLQPQEFFKIDRPPSSLGDGLTPAPDPILRRALSFDGETGARVLQQQEGRGADEQIPGHRGDRLLRALGQVHGGKCFGGLRAKDQGAEGRGAGQIVADPMAGRVFTRNGPLLLRVDDRLIVAGTRVG